MNTEQVLAKIINADLQIRQIKINGYRINYATAGAGDPLVLIHGGNIGWGQWYPNIAELSRHFKVFALDLPGGGRSDRLDFAKLDLDKDLTEVTEEFINSLGLKNASLVGSSVGGWVAVKIAARGKVKVNKLILADSVGFSDHFRFADRLIGFYPFAKFLSRTVLRPVRSNKNIERFLRSVFYNSTVPLSKEFVDYFYETMATSHNLLFISRLASSDLRNQVFLKEDLPSVKNKTLIIWGGEDKLMPLEKNSGNFSLLPNYEAKTIKEAGHIPSIEKPADFNKIVLEFLHA